MSERDVIVTSWVYDDAALNILIEELRVDYPTSLRTYEGRVACVNDMTPRGVVASVRAALTRTCERLDPDHGSFKVVCIPEDGPAITFEIHDRKVLRLVV